MTLRIAPPGHAIVVKRAEEQYHNEKTADFSGNIRLSIGGPQTQKLDFSVRHGNLSFSDESETEVGYMRAANYEKKRLFASDSRMFALGAQ